VISVLPAGRATVPPDSVHNIVPQKATDTVGWREDAQPIKA